ncbi:hypothetical protein QJS10_CPA05g00892 [Acorus calamus]|uniref:Uncharacterized protein n=1 Tax=Acorus calamus TaxID=4465 RepID=A0AAV9ES74_ACOCL|nr:hypothetical protein QJS10_CPA05g00892 [Acorus calamus]
MALGPFHRTRLFLMYKAMHLERFTTPEEVRLSSLGTCSPPEDWSEVESTNDYLVQKRKGRIHREEVNREWLVRNDSKPAQRSLYSTRKHSSKIVIWFSAFKMYLHRSFSEDNKLNYVFST